MADWNWAEQQFGAPKDGPIIGEKPVEPGLPVEPGPIYGGPNEPLPPPATGPAPAPTPTPAKPPAKPNPHTEFAAGPGITFNPIVKPGGTTPFAARKSPGGLRPDIPEFDAYARMPTTPVAPPTFSKPGAPAPTGGSLPPAQPGPATKSSPVAETPMPKNLAAPVTGPSLTVSKDLREYGFIPPPEDEYTTGQMVKWKNNDTGEEVYSPSSGWTPPTGWVQISEF
jgi:hypothetical protein